jgi:hypothetical protein
MSVRASLLLAVTLGLAVACVPEPSSAPLRVVSTPAGPDTRLVLISASHIRLNARVKPALELPDGRVLRFDSPHLTADSAYFASPPTATLDGRHDRVHGTIRASVCENDAPICRALVVKL